MSTAYKEASVYIPPSAGVKAGTLQAWRPDVNLLQDIDVSRPATTNVASYIDNTGTRVFVGANVPRWDWSEGLSCPSLLVEPQRTNLFDQDLAGAGIVTRTVTVVSGTKYSVSVEGSGSMTLSGAGTGTVTEGSHVTFTASTTSLTLTLTGALDYCQVEAGAYPSSIIYTSGGVATRNADVISKTGIANLIGQSEGTFYLEAQYFSKEFPSNFMSLSDDTTNNRVFFGINNTSGAYRFLVTKGDFLQYNSSTGISANEYTTFKFIVNYAPNNFSLISNGSVLDTGSAGDTFSTNTLNAFKFDDGNGNNSFFGRIKKIVWYKNRLTDAEGQNLTS